MQARIKAELQMLREFFWLHAPQIPCEFCGEPLVLLPEGMTFGHRRHPPIEVSITVHHNDRNRENNTRENLKDSHSLCHKLFHAKERQNAAKTSDR